MSSFSGANLIHATRPFVDLPEIRTKAEHANYVGFRADRNYFDMFPRRKHAIRLALCEFDELALMGDVPPPPLYVFVTRLSATERSIEPIYRGVPFWTEQYCGNFRYAARASDALLFELMLNCRGFGGMLLEARMQFDRHEEFVTSNRLALGIAREGR